MRLLFMGSPAEVISPLEQLLNASAQGRFQLLGVVSQPARPAGRKQTLTDPPVAAFAKERGLACWQPEKASSPDFLALLRGLKPDVVITAAYGQILSESFLQIPHRATINVHPSLLPLYRGATPVEAALLDGREETGVTILFTVRALDAGAIICQKSFAIGPEETAAELTPRLFHAGGELLLEALEKLRDPDFKGTEQDPAKVVLCKKIAKTDGAVIWNKLPKQLFNEFRAYQPWPGTFTVWGEQRIVIEEMRLAPGEQQSLTPGSFVWDKAHKSLRVGTGGLENILVSRLKPAGSKSVEAQAFWNGSRLKDEGRFDPVSI